MNRKKKVSAILLVMVMMFSLNACGQSQPSAANDAQESASSSAAQTAVTQEDAAASESEEALTEIGEEEEETGAEEAAASSAAGREDALAMISKAGIGDIVSDSDNLMGMGLKDVHVEDDGDLYVSWAFTNEMMRGNMSYAYTRVRFFDPDDLSTPFTAFTINEDDTFSVTIKTGDQLGSYDYVHVKHEEFDPDSGVIFMYFDGSGEGAPDELYTVPLVFTIYKDSDGAHTVEDLPRYAPEEIISAFQGN